MRAPQGRCGKEHDDGEVEASAQNAIDHPSRADAREGRDSLNEKTQHKGDDSLPP
jgi:hypothetical protein